MGRGIGAFILMLCLGPCGAPASADYEEERPFLVWCWYTRDGVLSFSDREKQIPKAYKAGADVLSIGYERLTVVKPAEEERAAQLKRRLTRLRGGQMPAKQAPQ